MFVIAGALAVGCGGARRGGPAAPPKPRLVEGEAIYELRYNPARCLGESAHQFEVRTPQGWERVALENPDEERDLVAELARDAALDPAGIFRVRGALLADAFPIGGEHASRILRLLVLDPPPPEEPPPEVP